MAASGDKSPRGLKLAPHGSHHYWWAEGVLTAPYFLRASGAGDPAPPLSVLTRLPSWLFESWPT